MNGLIDWTLVSQALMSSLPYVLLGGVVVALSFALRKWGADPHSKFATYTGMVIQSVLLVEKVFAANQQNPGMVKADMFLQEFIKMYQDEQGKEPEQALKDWAMRAKELVVLKLKELEAKKNPVQVTQSGQKV